MYVMCKKYNVHTKCLLCVVFLTKYFNYPFTVNDKILLVYVCIMYKMSRNNYYKRLGTLERKTSLQNHNIRVHNLSDKSWRDLSDCSEKSLYYTNFRSIN